ncbi:hypothetical protein TNCT_236971 [Trichonephila clavata]|uniref:Uncharacterized protein n=1 Tax=Trichonephila clavata TaxID=2740835 RepID=A0A8X6FKX6_TRICU|nr:hypothetical protein TNCT_236971 [Trichonephila clavata]
MIRTCEKTLRALKQYVYQEKMARLKSSLTPVKKKKKHGGNERKNFVYDTGKTPIPEDNKSTEKKVLCLDYTWVEFFHMIVIKINYALHAGYRRK